MHRKRVSKIMQSWLILGTVCSDYPGHSPCSLKAFGNRDFVHSFTFDSGKEGQALIRVLAVSGILVKPEYAAQIFADRNLAWAIGAGTFDCYVPPPEINILSLEAESFTHERSRCIKKN
jgi:hypothetical protein